MSAGSSGRSSIVNGPRAGLDRAIANLIDNACKFDETGGPIEVVVGAGSLTVLDRGPGIPETDLTKVFDRFHRADTARAMPGSGLGLAIVRDVVERMDGTVRAENRVRRRTVDRLRRADRQPVGRPITGCPITGCPITGRWRGRSSRTRCSSLLRWEPPRRPLRPRRRRPGCEIVRRGVNRRAVVVGAGPNGLVAAITLARAGWDVTVYEAAARPGGGTRSEELTVPGVIHDVCSAIHPLAVGSPAFREIAAAGALAEHGLEWIHSDVPLAHPLDGGRAAVLHRSVDDTATGPRPRCARRIDGCSARWSTPASGSSTGSCRR